MVLFPRARQRRKLYRAERHAYLDPPPPPTIADLRAELEKKWDMPMSVRAFRGDVMLEEEYIPRPGDYIEWKPVS